MINILKFASSIVAIALLSTGTAGAVTFKTIYSVVGSHDGGYPTSKLIDVGGTLYGSTPYGGASGNGAVYSFNPTTGVEAVVCSFGGANDGANPVGALVSVAGTLYGATASGGVFGFGTVFSVDLATGAERVVYSFAGGNDGNNPQAGLLNVGGTLYGSTLNGGQNGSGHVFSLNPATGALSVVYTFTGGNDGAYPESELIDVGGKLYGTTFGGRTSGNVFSIDPATGAETVVYNFTGGNDGGSPQAALINIGGVLYGTTSAGGSLGGGTVFSLNPATGAATAIYNFPGEKYGAAYSQGGLIDLGGKIYGTTPRSVSGDGHVFSLDPATGAVRVVYTFTGGNDGAYPEAALFHLGGRLYGTTSAGGASGFGALYNINPASGAEAVSHSFSGSFANSYNGLLSVNGQLFVSASAGGAAGIGEIVKLSPLSSPATELYAFATAQDGALSLAPLMYFGGKFYGTTYFGGQFGNGPRYPSESTGLGTVFSFDPATRIETVVHSFGAGTDGYYPAASLVYASGKLYGTTSYGGAVGNSPGSGTIISINPKTGAELVAYSFGNGDGAHPNAALTNFAGKLYGTDDGAVFGFDPAGGSLRIFPGVGSGGVVSGPTAPMINVGGILYGTTLQGNTAVSANGTVFSFNPATGAERVIYSFAGGKDGFYPEGALAALGSKLYGTTYYGGAFGWGTVFSIDPATGAETVIYSFTGGTDGALPNAAVINIGGTLYGTTSTRGATGLGTVFKLIP